MPKNKYSEQYEQHEQEELTKRLTEKYSPKPYYLRFQSLHTIAIAASYVFNVFSAITASTLVYFFSMQLTKSEVASFGICLVFLVLLEATKRSTALKGLVAYYQYKTVSIGLLMVYLVLMVLSVSSSYYGAKKAVHEFTKPVHLIDADSLTAPIDQRIADLEQQQQAARETKWQGTTTTASQKTIETLTNQIATLENEKMRLAAQTEQTNAVRQNKHSNRTKISAETFAMVAILLEFLFLLSVGYMEYYDYRSYVELSRDNITGITHKKLVYTKDNADLESEIPPPNNNGVYDKNTTEFPIDITDKAAIQSAIKNANKNITTYKWKLRNNKGKPETAKANLTKWTEEKERLEQLLTS